MTFTRSILFLCCSLSLFTALNGCSNNQDDDKKQKTLTASAPVSGEASTVSERNNQQRLIETLSQHLKKAGINAKITDARPTEVPNLYWVNLEGMGTIYATADGQYILQGDIIRLGEKQLMNIGDGFQADLAKKAIAQLNSKDLIIYPAENNKAKQVIYVFTDVSCPYCHKFHEQIPELNKNGIEVRYVAWPRGEEHMPLMESIWCSADRRAAFDQALTGAALPPATCKNPVKTQYELGLSIGVNGTPAIYSSEGVYLGGFLEAKELIKLLNN